MKVKVDKEEIRIEVPIKVWKVGTTILKIGLPVGVFIGMAYPSLTNLSWIEAYRRINWGLLGFQIIFIPLLLLCGIWLYGLHPGLMGFGLWTIVNWLTGKKQEHYEDGTPKLEGANIFLWGIDIKYLGIGFCLAMMTYLPQLAAFEEDEFRQGTTGWPDAMIRSLKFGLVHMAVGLPVVAVLIASVTGLFLSYLYFVGGLELCTQAHFQHNLILFSIILVLITIRSLWPSKIEHLINQ